MTTEMDLLRQADPAPGPLPTSARHELLTSLRSMTPAEAPKKTGRRATILTACSAAVLAVTGGLAYAFYSQAPATALKINCAAGVSQQEFEAEGGFTAVIDVVSGDPVADCARQYQHLGGEVPPLRAYESGSPFVWVLPSSWQAPSDWRELTSGFRSDSDRLTLKQRLQDPVDGPAADCRTTEATEELVRSYWTELALSGWTLAPAPGAESGDGVALCAFALLDEAGGSTVLIQTGPPLPEGTSDQERAYRSLIVALRERVADPCLALPEAEREVEALLAASTVEATVSAAPEASGPCTSVDLVTGGGPFTVTLS